MRLEHLLDLMETLAELDTTGTMTMDRAYVDIGGVRLVPVKFEYRKNSNILTHRHAHAALVKVWMRFIDTLQGEAPPESRVLVWRSKPSYMDGIYSARLCYVDGSGQ